MSGDVGNDTAAVHPLAEGDSCRVVLQVGSRSRDLVAEGLGVGVVVSEKNGGEEARWTRESWRRPIVRHASLQRLFRRLQFLHT